MPYSKKRMPPSVKWSNAAASKTASAKNKPEKNGNAQ